MDDYLIWIHNVDYHQEQTLAYGGHSIGCASESTIQFSGTMSPKLLEMTNSQYGSVTGVNQILNDCIKYGTIQKSSISMEGKSKTLQEAWNTFNELYKIETGESF